MQSIRLEEEIHIERPVDIVFRAWSTADALADWFAPMAVERPDVELDFRQSGHYAIRMRLPGGQVFTTAGVFEEIVPNRRIVMTWRCDAFPDPTTRVTVRFIEDGAGTIVKVLHENFENADTCTNHSHGWELCLAELQSVLERSEGEQ